MHSRWATRLRLLLAVGCLTFWGAVPAQAGREVSKTGKASATGTVEIENIAGSIVVEGWGREEISLEGTLGEEVEELRFKTGGKKSRIEVEYPRRVKTIEEGAHLVIKVPRGSSLEIECVSATIDVSGVTGRIEAASVSGDVTIEGPCRSVEAESISGEVNVNGVAEEVQLSSISGRIVAQGDVARVQAETVSGELDLRYERFRELSVETVSGDAEITGDLDPDGTVRLDLHSGDLRLIVPAEVSAEFEISSFSGDIDNDFGFKAKRTSKYAPGQELEFSVGGGGARVRINTFSGDVHIRKQ